MTVVIISSINWGKSAAISPNRKIACNRGGRGSSQIGLTLALHGQGTWPGICTSDHGIVVGRDSAVSIMDDTPNVVALLINLYYHPFLCKYVK